MKLVTQEPGDPAIVFTHDDETVALRLLVLLDRNPAAWNKELRRLVGEAIDKLTEEKF